MGAPSSRLLYFYMPNGQDPGAWNMKHQLALNPRNGRLGWLVAAFHEKAGFWSELIEAVLSLSDLVHAANMGILKAGIASCTETGVGKMFGGGVCDAHNLSSSLVGLRHHFQRQRNHIQELGVPGAYAGYCVPHLFYRAPC